MPERVTNFLQDEHGQDLLEYTLLVAFLALTSSILFISSGAAAHISTAWNAGSSQLSLANRQ
jgi:Flp pilus assembly pilin Flp